MKAVKNFRRLVDPNKAGQAIQSILGGDIEPNFVEPPMEIDPSDEFPAVGLDPSVKGSGLGRIRKFLERQSALGDNLSDSSPSPASSKQPSGVFEPEQKDSASIRSGRTPGKTEFDASHHSHSASPIPVSRASSATTKRSAEGTRGHARDPLECEFPYLFIGPSTYTGAPVQEPSDFNIGSDPVPLVEEPDNAFEDSAADNVQMVSESPGAADFDIYETAYRSELERINNHSVKQEATPKVYLTRRVQNKDEVLQFVKDKAIDLQTGARNKILAPGGKASTAFGAAVSLLRNQIEKKDAEEKAYREKGREEEPGSSSTEPSERRPSNPPMSSLSSQTIPGPEASSLEATGVPVPETRPRGNSASQLRRLLEKTRQKGEE